MITLQDCMLLLTEIGEKEDIDTSTQIKSLLKTRTVSIDAVKFINQHRQMDLNKFFEKIRKSYNDKKSKLYINIVKEVENPNDVLTTLSALALQILLYGDNADDKSMFYHHARLDEIYKSLYNYSLTNDIVPCIKVIKIIKADIKAFESIK